MQHLVRYNLKAAYAVQGACPKPAVPSSNMMHQCQNMHAIGLSMQSL